MSYNSTRSSDALVHSQVQFQHQLWRIMSKVVIERPRKKQSSRCTIMLAQQQEEAIASDWSRVLPSAKTSGQWLRTGLGCLDKVVLHPPIAHTPPTTRPFLIFRKQRRNVYFNMFPTDHMECFGEPIRPRNVHLWKEKKCEDSDNLYVSHSEALKQVEIN